jgi:hypothetical protein
MLLHSMHLELARQRREQEIAEAARARALPPAANPLRQAVGRSMIRIGARLAAEPQTSDSLRLARSA